MHDVINTVTEFAYNTHTANKFAYNATTKGWHDAKPFEFGTKKLGWDAKQTLIGRPPQQGAQRLTKFWWP